MRRFLTRAAVGTAIAAAAVLTVAGTAGAAAKPAAKAPTTLSIVEAKTSIKPGQTDVIGGTLKSGKSPLAGKIIILDRVVGKKLVPVKDAVTGKAGNAAFVVKPKATARYSSCSSARRPCRRAAAASSPSS